MTGEKPDQIRRQPRRDGGGRNAHPRRAAGADARVLHATRIADHEDRQARRGHGHRLERQQQRVGGHG